MWYNAIKVPLLSYRRWREQSERRRGEKIKHDNLGKKMLDCVIHDINHGLVILTTERRKDLKNNQRERRSIISLQNLIRVKETAALPLRES